jgi:hypothetical protein
VARNHGALALQLRLLSIDPSLLGHFARSLLLLLPLLLLPFLVNLQHFWSFAGKKGTGCLASPYSEMLSPALEAPTASPLAAVFAPPDQTSSSMLFRRQPWPTSRD